MDNLVAQGVSTEVRCPLLVDDGFSSLDGAPSSEFQEVLSFLPQGNVFRRPEETSASANPLVVSAHASLPQSPPLIAVGSTPDVSCPPCHAALESLSKISEGRKERKGDLGLASGERKERSFKAILLDPGEAHSDSKLWAFSQVQNQVPGYVGLQNAGQLGHNLNQGPLVQHGSPTVIAPDPGIPVRSDFSSPPSDCGVGRGCSTTWGDATSAIFFSEMC